MVLKRTFLFLQGPGSPFFPRLARALKSSGHETHRVAFCGGDALLGFRHFHRTHRFAGDIDELPGFVRSLVTRLKVTDMFLFGDCRPIHEAAVSDVSKKDVRVWVFEEGYLRPHWVTLERDGTNGKSALPRRPENYLSVESQAQCTSKTVSIRQSIRRRLYHQAVYEAAKVLDPFFFPRYRSHLPDSRIRIASGWAARIAWGALYASRERRRAVALSQRPYFFVPLQLEHDAQVQRHSCFRSVAQMLDVVLTSFASCAPSDHHLLVKNHPLAHVFWRSHSQVAKHRLEHRVHFLEDGDAELLIERSKGVVVINSTLGLRAIAKGIPTHVLGTAIYKIKGLVGQGSLDEFWCDQERPNETLADAVIKFMKHRTQLNGGFYSPEAIDLAVANTMSRVLVAEDRE